MQIWDFRSGVAEDSNHLGYYAVSLGNRIPTFRRNVMLSSARVEMSKKDTDTWFLISLAICTPSFQGPNLFLKNESHLDDHDIFQILWNTNFPQVCPTASGPKLIKSSPYQRNLFFNIILYPRLG